VILVSPDIDNYEVDLRSGDAVGIGLSGEVKEVWSRVFGARWSVEIWCKYWGGRHLSLGMVEVLKGTIHLHSHPFTALPTDDLLFQDPEESFPKW